MGDWREHLHLLRCPGTGEAVRLATAPELETLNSGIAARHWLHADGSAVMEPLKEPALTNASGTRFYRLEQDVACLLPMLAIVRAEDAGKVGMAAESAVVRSFYENFGWDVGDGGAYNDSALFARGEGQTAANYYRRCMDRVLAQLSGGKYLLDAASGPVPGPAYVMLSQRYEKRICVDFSLAALREARRNIGDHGLFLLGDLTRLPLADGAATDTISLHTIYHVPAEAQLTAVD